MYHNIAAQKIFWIFFYEFYRNCEQETQELHILHVYFLVRTLLIIIFIALNEEYLSKI